MSENSNIQFIKYNPKGNRLSLKVNFVGLVLGTYEYLLWEAESNDTVLEEKGNNKNPFDDEYPLPMPLSANNDRIIDVRAKFLGLDPTNSDDFKISAEIWQGEHIIGEAFDESTKERKLDGNGLESQLYIILESEPNQLTNNETE